MGLRGGGGKGSLAVHLGFIEYNARVEPQLAFQDLPLRTTSFANHPLPTPLNLVLANSSGRYGIITTYTGLWHFCVHLDSSLFFGTSFRPSRRRRTELTASPSDFEGKRSLPGSSGLVIELDCTIRTFIRSLTALMILASKGFIREGPRARILLAR